MKIPQYNLILLNDDDHTYNYVVIMLMDVFGHSSDTCLDLAKEVDKEGRVIVWRGPLEHVEFKLEQIRAYGPDPSIPHCIHSMTAEIKLIE